MYATDRQTDRRQIASSLNAPSAGHNNAECTKCFNSHVTTHGLLPTYQSAYRPRYSTETATTSVFNDISCAVDAGQVCALVLLDLSAAFDTVDHGILSEVLEKRFAIDGGVFEWFRSYLSVRTQTYRVANASVLVELTCVYLKGPSVVHQHIRKISKTSSR